MPLAITATKAGFAVLGFDIDEGRVKRINAGETMIRYIDGSLLKEASDKGLFEATADFSRLSEADVILICVPTPLTRHREPDLSFVSSTATVMAQYLRAGQLIILESTTYPGTRMRCCGPFWKKAG